MTWASHPTAEMPASRKPPAGRHRRRLGVISGVAAVALLVLTVTGAMLSPTLLGWPPPSRQADPSTVATPPVSPPSPATTAPSPTAASPPAPTPTTAPTTTKPAPTQPTPAGTAAATGFKALEDGVLKLTNAERAEGGCGSVVLDTKLRAAARLHSADMADNGYFSHDSPDGKDPGKRMRDAGYNTDRGWAENIAVGYPTAAAVMSGWMRSPGHRGNILNCSMRSMGVGVSRADNGRLYWTQDLGGR